ncbi:acetylxylan esterase [Pochonia chlamydosporia 170]|uniref:Acetylxylan esterase n=1 Tax=Pochonia chlamydosporia 170 TaxID=1380566 RepID=A0A179F3D5_METCM|nr:acetylxylan esterase [Pochonia chlamydosporia 170]OAQ59936.1 acetylxylan esterase [Pochonia chlamydosporia 170]
MFQSKLALLSTYALLASAQSCPSIHVFGARETTVSPGYGSAGALIDMIKAAHPGTTSEAIVYPACGGQSSCGGVAYGDSARQGTIAVAAAVNAFHSQCPTTQLILVGYSQGGQIMDNALCGGGDPGAGISDTSVPISSSAVAMIKAAIFMGDPRYEYGFTYEVGTCRAGGFDARPASFKCPNASKIQSYCDSQDPYCCTGNDANHHQQYVSIYGQQAMTFINGKLSGNSGGGSDPGNGGTGTCAALWGQCGGMGWTGPTCCAQGSCKAANAYYSQCLN